MEQIKGPGMGPRSMTLVGGDVDGAQLKAELVLMKRKNERLVKKEKRIQVRTRGWYLVPSRLYPYFFKKISSWFFSCVNQCIFFLIGMMT
jgi:hypothetical protein